MGRSVPTYRMTLESVIMGWAPFRKALRGEDRELFDSVMIKARMHASAGSYQATTDPAETVFLSVLIEQEKELQKLRETILLREELAEKGSTGGKGSSSSQKPLGD